MTLDYAALKAELQNDPTNLGYSPLIANGSDSGLAALLNTVNAATTLFRSDVTIHDIVGSIASTDYAAMVTLQIMKLQLLFTGVSMLDLTVANTRQILTDLFSAASASSKAALVTMAKRPASRSEILFGAGVVVQHKDIAIALRG